MVHSGVAERKDFFKLSLVKVNPEIWKLRKEQFKLKSKFDITEKIC